jgi:hypothetical protein
MKCGFYGAEVDLNERAFTLIFYREIKDVTRCEIDLMSARALTVGLSMKFREGWGRALYSGERGDKTLVCPACGQRYDELATLLEMNDAAEGEQPGFQCKCGSQLRTETVFACSIVRFEVPLDFNPANLKKLAFPDQKSPRPRNMVDSFLRQREQG